MGGKIDFGGLDLVCELLGVDDVELLLTHLVLLRDRK
jgi:hypothetical protein